MFGGVLHSKSQLHLHQRLKCAYERLLLLLSTHVWSLPIHTLAMVARACYPSPLEIVGGPEFQGHPKLYSKFDVILGYKRSCLKTETESWSIFLPSWCY